MNLASARTNLADARSDLASARTDSAAATLEVRVSELSPHRRFTTICNAQIIEQVSKSRDFGILELAAARLNLASAMLDLAHAKAIIADQSRKDQKAQNINKT